MDRDASPNHADDKRPTRRPAWGVFQSQPVRCVLFGQLLILLAFAWVTYGPWRDDELAAPLALGALWLGPPLLVLAVRCEKRSADHALWAILAQVALTVGETWALLPLVQ